MTNFATYRARPARRALLAAWVGLTIAILAVLPARAGEPVTVVELFTSQGCSSCPPADRFLGELATRDDVVALTLPVDYWDYLGWKDTLASPAYTQRQHAYARNRGDRKVYTPQMVFNGRTHAVGSHGASVYAEIAAQAESEARVAVDLMVDEDTIMVKAGALPAGMEGQEATLWLFLTSKAETVAIGRGENTGATVTYHNVVRMMMPIGSWDGSAIEVALPRSDLMRGYDGCAAILQVDGAGPILGASFLDGAELPVN